MFFRKRRVPGALLAHDEPPVRPPDPSERYLVGMDIMLKGARLKRRGKEIRQIAVMMDGSPKVVTSGDYVDRATFEALIAAGAIQAPSTEPRRQPSQEPLAEPG